MDSLKLAQLMCSRLCHDLITPIGAISTGLEIISENPDDIDSELMDLTSKSAHNAAQRLIYYRAAFGFSAAGNLDAPAKIKQLLEGYVKSCKVHLEFIDGLEYDDQDMVKNYARIILNCVGVILEAAPYGGDLKIDIQKGTSGLVCHLDLRGDLVGLKAENKVALEGQLNESEITPYSAQSYLTNLLIDKENARLTFTENTKVHVALTIRGAQLMSSLF